MQLAGKLVSQVYLNADTPGHLVHFMDPISQRRVIVNTGSSDSILLHWS
jgi:hypothetical protein